MSNEKWYLFFLQAFLRLSQRPDYVAMFFANVINFMSTALWRWKRSCHGPCTVISASKCYMMMFRRMCWNRNWRMDNLSHNLEFLMGGGRHEQSSCSTHFEMSFAKLVF